MYLQINELAQVTRWAFRWGKTRVSETTSGLARSDTYVRREYTRLSFSPPSVLFLSRRAAAAACGSGCRRPSTTSPSTDAAVPQSPPPIPHRLDASPLSRACPRAAANPSLGFSSVAGAIHAPPCLWMRLLAVYVYLLEPLIDHAASASY